MQTKTFLEERKASRSRDALLQILYKVYKKGNDNRSCFEYLHKKARASKTEKCFTGAAILILL